MEDTTLDVRDVARIIIRQFGDDSPAILRRRVQNHERRGTVGSARYWAEVAAAVDGILDGHWDRPDGSEPDPAPRWLRP